MSASDIVEQTDEAASIEAIFGDDAEFDPGLHTYRVRHSSSRPAAAVARANPSLTHMQQQVTGRSPWMQVYLPSKSCELHVVLRVLLPPTYPSSAGPVMELEAAHVPEQRLAAAVKHMEDMFTPGEQQAEVACLATLRLGFTLLLLNPAACSPPHAGQVCLFDCIEWLREQLQQWQDEAAAAELAAAAEQQLGVGSSDGDDDGASEDDDDLDAALQHLPEASTSQVATWL